MLIYLYVKNNGELKKKLFSSLNQREIELISSFVTRIVSDNDKDFSETTSML